MTPTELAAKLREWAEEDVMETARDMSFEPNDARKWASLMHQAADEIDRIAEALAAEREAWRPIETAPKDGTRALLLDLWGNPEIGRWIGAPHDHWSVDGFRSVPAPTHWQPLPTPPAIRTGRSEGTP
jgi:hypothetical protein